MNPGDPPTFGPAKFSISGNSNIIANDTTLQLSTRLLPSEELSVREVYWSMEP